MELVLVDCDRIEIVTRCNSMHGTPAFARTHMLRVTRRNWFRKLRWNTLVMSAISPIPNNFGASLKWTQCCWSVYIQLQNCFQISDKQLTVHRDSTMIAVALIL